MLGQLVLGGAAVAGGSAAVGRADLMGTARIAMGTLAAPPPKPVHQMPQLTGKHWCKALLRHKPAPTQKDEDVFLHMRSY